jgi:multiple sugar transport system permease protein
MVENKMKRRQSFFPCIRRILLYLFAAILCICFIFPFFWMLRTSLMELKQIFLLPPVFLPDPLYWQNYPEAFGHFPLLRFIGNSFLISILSVVGAVFTSSLCAFGFSRIQWKLREPIFTVVLCSMMLPYAVTIIPTYLGWNMVGGVDTYLPLILPSWCGGGAMYIFLLRQFFLSLPKELDESAIVDGAGYFTIYSRIILPLTKPALIVVMLFSFQASWNDFLSPIVYLNTTDKYPMSVGLQLFSSSYSVAYGELMAVAVIAVLPCVLLFFAGQKYFIEGIALTGIKG